MALWWLLPAGVARVELVGVPFPCGAGRSFGGFGGFEAWQTAALNAYKKPLLRPWIAVALWWLLRAGVARVGLVGVPFPCGAGRTFGGFEAWQTAALNAYKKPLLRPGGALEPLLRPGGALQPLLWPCGGFCVREWRVLGLLGYLFPAELGGLLEGLRPGKRQP